MNTIARYIHGSANSTDLDVVYVVEGHLPDLAECKNFCSADPIENRNIVCVENGVVVETYKGTVDETNNAIFSTYPLHKQTDELLITRMLERDFNTKMIRAVRIILSHFSHSQFRPEIKQALRSNWTARLNALQTIASNISAIDLESLNKKMSGVDILKTVAFQIGQTYLLYMGYEVYTKKDVCTYIPCLTPYIRREKTDTDVISRMLEKFIRICQNCNYKDISETEVRIMVDNEPVVYDLIKENRI